MAKKRPSKAKPRPARAAPKKQKPAMKSRTPAPTRKTGVKAARRPARTAVRSKASSKPMRVVEVSHLPDAAIADAGIAPEKGAHVEVETAHQHVEMEPHPAHPAAAAAVPVKHTLLVRVRDWFSAVPNVEVVLSTGSTVVGRQKTDEHGVARFADLAPGEYQYETVFRGDIKKHVNLSRDRTVTVRFW